MRNTCCGSWLPLPRASNFDQPVRPHLCAPPGCPATSQSRQQSGYSHANSDLRLVGSRPTTDGMCPIISCLSEKRFNGDGGLLLAFGLPLATADAALNFIAYRPAAALTALGAATCR